ncbi:MAG: DUF1015 domain-containing protein [Dehalococcoidales bacterium]|nr:DUF1015 domain-containing protein [Dehalococcoidales bacterium]
MAEIRPFHGVHYSHAKVKDLPAVICPPYDIIPPQMREELYQRSEYNFVRLEYTRPLPDEKDAMAKYARASATLEDWLKQGVLEVADKPAFYLHDHYFNLRGRNYQRRGIVTLVKLEEWSKGVVRPHEGTLKEPKGDRLSLLWALNANTSSVFGLFTDKDKQVANLFEKQAHGKPMLDFKIAGGERQVMWAITDGAAVNELCRLFADQPLYIADGHHRYESALAYSREKRACNPSATGTQPYDYLMMTLVDFADPGLIILPAHRLVRGLSQETLAELRSKLETFFSIEKVPLKKDATAKQVESLLAEPPDEVKLMLAGLEKENLFVLRLRDFTAAGEMMPSFHSDLYKRLDVSVLDHVILEKLLGVGFERELGTLAFSYDREDAMRRVGEGEFQIALLLNPVRPESIKGIADAGDRMPRKSTYFYPKLPAGLVFYKMG